jgi:hypothetical protein
MGWGEPPKTNPGYGPVYRQIVTASRLQKMLILMFGIHKLLNEYQNEIQKLLLLFISCSACQKILLAQVK